MIKTTNNAIAFEQNAITADVTLTFAKEENGSLKVFAWRDDTMTNSFLLQGEELAALKDFMAKI
jgi:hypothetical protein